jgi:predicted transcriptional regulator
MGGRTLRKQVPLYLDDDQVEGLDQLARTTGETKQALLRRAVTVLLKDWDLIRKRSDAARKKAKP